MEIRLVPINSANRDECLALGVARGQEKYICPNSESLRAAAESRDIARPFAIYAGDTMVGFTMFAFDSAYDDPDDRYWLWRFMIGAGYQGQGYGSLALKEIIGYFRQNGAGHIRLSTKSDNAAAISLYRKYGFRESGGMNGDETVYSRAPKDKPALYIIIAGDRGLAGGYNANIFRLAAEQPDFKGAKVIAIGRKAIEKYAHSPDVEMIAEYPGLAERMRVSTVQTITRQLLRLWHNREISRVRILFTQFVTALNQQASILDVLPLSLRNAAGRQSTEIIYDPSPQAVFSAIIPQYLTGIIYGAVTESYASEQGARRTAMEAATGNAEEMIRDADILDFVPEEYRGASGSEDAGMEGGSSGTAEAEESGERIEVGEIRIGEEQD